MARTKREDMRLLSREELDLVAQSRQPAVRKLSDQPGYSGTDSFTLEVTGQSGVPFRHRFKVNVEG